MSIGLKQIRDADLYASMQGILLPQLAQILQDREDGHCMRVGNLPMQLMVDLWRSLREANRPWTRV